MVAASGPGLRLGVMAKGLPKDMMQKRAVLYSERASKDEQNAVADAFIAEERYGEALEFLELTRDAGRLDEIRRIGIEAGDTFLLLRAERISGEAVPAETWKQTAERAKARERYYDAYRALERAGLAEEAEALREEHLPDFTPFRPEGK